MVVRFMPSERTSERLTSAKRTCRLTCKRRGHPQPGDHIGAIADESGNQPFGFRRIFGRGHGAGQQHGIGAHGRHLDIGFGHRQPQHLVDAVEVGADADIGRPDDITRSIAGIDRGFAACLGQRYTAGAATSPGHRQSHHWPRRYRPWCPARSPVRRARLTGRCPAPGRRYWAWAVAPGRASSGAAAQAALSMVLVRRLCIDLPFGTMPVEVRMDRKCGLVGSWLVTCASRCRRRRCAQRLPCRVPCRSSSAPVPRATGPTVMAVAAGNPHVGPGGHGRGGSASRQPCRHYPADCRAWSIRAGARDGTVRRWKRETSPPV